jgi:hypothetical protein
MTEPILKLLITTGIIDEYMTGVKYTIHTVPICEALEQIAKLRCRGLKGLILGKY